MRFVAFSTSVAARHARAHADSDQPTTVGKAIHSALTVFVWVPLARQLVVCLLDLPHAGSLGNALRTVHATTHTCVCVCLAHKHLCLTASRPVSVWDKTSAMTSINLRAASAVHASAFHSADQNFVRVWSFVFLSLPASTASSTSPREPAPSRESPPSGKAWERETNWTSHQMKPLRVLRVREISLQPRAPSCSRRLRRSSSLFCL